MPLAFETLNHAPVCSLSEWHVVDHNLLIEALAWLYVRKPRHAARVMQALLPGDAFFPGREFDAARDLLRWQVDDIADDLASSEPVVRNKAEIKRDKRIEQRDGLLFQHISWIAAHLRFPGCHLSPPHVRKADKGFDGVLIRLGDGDATLSTVILCEDKATISPRQLVQSSIWPEIGRIELGDKDLEINDAVTALLDKVGGVDVEEVLRGVSWQRLRQYRVALTAPTSRAQDGQYGHIFAGFDEVVPMEIGARIAEFIALPDVRAFLDDLAARVRLAIDVLEANVVV